MVDEHLSDIIEMMQISVTETTCLSSNARANEPEILGHGIAIQYPRNNEGASNISST